MLKTLILVKQISDLFNGKWENIAISDAQIVECNFSLLKAHKMLTSSDFQAVKKKYDTYSKQKEKMILSLPEYLQRTMEIIEDFEQITPYYNLTEDDRAYRVALIERNEEKEAKNIFSAGINFLNAILSDSDICPDVESMKCKDFSELVYLQIAGHYRAVIAIMNWNGLLSDNVYDKAMRQLDAYIREHYLPDVSLEKFDYYYEAELGAYNMSCRAQNQMIDLFLRMKYFALMPLALSIDMDHWEEDPRVLKLWKYETEFHKAIAGGAYRYLKLN